MNFIMSGKKIWSGIQKATLLIAGICSGALFASDLPYCSVRKGVYYDQMMAGNPILKSPYAYLFNVTVMPVRRVTRCSG